VELRLDRAGLLLDQLEATCEYSRARLEGLTDEEYLWDPAPAPGRSGPRGQAATNRALGAGEWVLDLELPEPDPPPVTSIAWRLGHLTSGFEGRWHWTFAGPRAPVYRHRLVDQPRADPPPGRVRPPA
jgi:DinB superfamily